MGPADAWSDTRVRWLGEEDSNPHYQGQSLASYH